MTEDRTPGSTAPAPSAAPRGAQPGTIRAKLGLPDEQPPNTAPSTADVSPAPDGEWHGVERGLLRMRRLLVCGALLLAGLLLAVALGFLLGGGWPLLALVPWAVAAWCGWALQRNWRSWRYTERADDLLLERGVLWRRLTVVPYGRMQLVEVLSGPLQRRYGLARLKLHTAAATSDAAVPGLAPAEARRLRDRLTELGEARSAGL